MGRRKLETTQLIQSQKAIRKVFKQRRDGIIKKAFELSTLCDVEVGVIIYGPNGDPPTVWPKELESLHNIIKRYQETNVDERRKRAKNISCFTKNNNGNYQKKDDLVKPEKPTLHDKLDNLSAEQLLDLFSSLETKIGVVDARINMMKYNQNDFPKFEEVLSYNVGVAFEQGMMMNQAVQPNFQSGYPVYDHAQYGQNLEHQRQSDMMMMNDAGYCNLINNDDVGDYTGLLGGNFNDVMLNPNPLSWCYDLFNQMSEQQVQYVGGQGQLPFDYGFANY